MSQLVDPAALPWLGLLGLGLLGLKRRQWLTGFPLVLLCAGWRAMEFAAFPGRLLALVEAPYRGTGEA